jgi:hypothetical protein
VAEWDATSRSYTTRSGIQLSNMQKLYNVEDEYLRKFSINPPLQKTRQVLQKKILFKKTKNISSTRL